VARFSVSLNPTLMLTMILRMLATSGGKTIVFDYADFFLIVQVEIFRLPAITYRTWRSDPLRTWLLQNQP
jgi:hypothetical protein